MNAPACSLRALRSLSRPALSGWRYRQFTLSTPYKQSKRDDATTGHPPNASSLQEGKAAQTDSSVRFEHPGPNALSSEEPVRGQGGRRFKPTLASFSLEGKVAVVTGGARGLGLVMAQGLMTGGAQVALVDLNDEEAKKSAAKMIETFKQENPEADRVPLVTAHYSDVADPSSVQSAVREILASHKQIDILVTSAGFTENIDAMTYPMDRVRKLWGVNVDGTWLFSVEVAKHLKERKSPGSIVMISSMSGVIVNVPQPQAPYNASKAAVRQMAASLAVEWADLGIRVNCISPGYMLTALTEKILDQNPELKEKWLSLIPMGKLGRPEDLVGTVTYLASDASRYTTGADLRVDGGYTIT